MAVYEGARQRVIALPRSPRATTPSAPTVRRRRMRAAVRARRGPSPAAIVLAAIVVAFAAAFFSLSQDIRVSATGYEVDRLTAAEHRLQARADDLRSELNRLGKAPAIRKIAVETGLGPLPEPEVIAAR
jgi:cell division protein FtsL